MIMKAYYISYIMVLWNSYYNTEYRVPYFSGDRLIILYIFSYKCWYGKLCCVKTLFYCV